jgi:U3 small nucleolar RNA-associated protein 13
MASAPTLKKNYRCGRSLQQFYTGGPFALGRSSGGEGEAAAEEEAFLACACGGEVRLVSSADAAAIGEPIDGDSEAITALALSHDARFLFAAGHSRLVRVWDLASRACIRSWKVCFPCLGVVRGAFVWYRLFEMPLHVQVLANLTK